MAQPEPVRRWPGILTTPPTLSAAASFEHGVSTLADIAALVQQAHTAGAPDTAVVWTHATRDQRGEIAVRLIIRWPEAPGA